MYYKIVHGFDAEDYVQINDTELEKAFYCFLLKKDSVYSGGAVKGSNILAIQPDYHKAMGWNRGYKLESEDYEELAQKGIDRRHTKFLSEVKEKVQYLIDTKQDSLVGKNVKIPELDTSGKIDNAVSKESKLLSDKFKIKT